MRATPEASGGRGGDSESARGMGPVPSGTGSVPWAAASRPHENYIPRVPFGGTGMAAKGPRSIVCIKLVPKAQELQVDPVTNTLRRVGVPSEINPPDRNAIEMALEVRDRSGGEVLVLSMGPPVFATALEEALAMGCDRAFLLTDRALGGSDTVPTALALSETIHKIGGYDLVFCGEETTDSSTGHVGPGIAGHLDCAQITYCSGLEYLGGRVRGKRALEDGDEWWEAPTPCVVTVNFLSNKPRPPSLTGKIRVKRGGLVTTWSCADVGIDPATVGLKGSPTIVSKVDTVVLPSRQGKVFRGEPREAVAQLVAALAADKVVT